VAKRVFGIAGSGEIKCIYHYGDDRVTASFRSYAKDGTDSVVVQAPTHYGHTCCGYTCYGSTYYCTDSVVVQVDIYISVYHGPPYYMLTLTLTLTLTMQVDPFSKPPPAAAQLEEFQLLQAAERDCINEVSSK